MISNYQLAYHLLNPQNFHTPQIFWKNPVFLLHQLPLNEKYPIPKSIFKIKCILTYWHYCKFNFVNFSIFITCIKLFNLFLECIRNSASAIFQIRIKNRSTSKVDPFLNYLCGFLMLLMVPHLSAIALHIISRALSS